MPEQKKPKPNQIKTKPKGMGRKVKALSVLLEVVGFFSHADLILL